MVPQGPSLADWLLALVRSLHPLRWLLGLAGIALTGACLVMALSWFEDRPPQWQGWWEQPWEHVQRLVTEIAGSGLGGALVRLGPLLAVCAAGWTVVGGWIARHELLARRGRPDWGDAVVAPFGPTALVVVRLKSLLLSCPLIILFIALCLLPLLLAGWVNHTFGGIGAVVVALFLPFLLLANFLVLILVLGLPSWPLMAATLAAEGSDAFDGFSRAYSYVWQSPLRFCLLMATTVALAALPLAAVISLRDEVPAEARTAVLWLAAGLAGSLFWSLTALVYLHLRTAVDGTDANDLALDLLPATPAKAEDNAEPKQQKAEPLAQHGAGDKRSMGWRGNLIALGLFVCTWFLTAWLFARTGGNDATWLGWGLSEKFVPAVDGLHWVAAVIAAFWGVGCFGIALLLFLRSLYRSVDPVGSEPDAEHEPVRE